MSESTPSPAGGMLDKLKGKAKQVIGSVTSNDDLKTEGQLQEKTGDAVRQARQAEVQADQEQAEAEVDAALAENAIEAQRLESEQAAEARQADVERDAAQTQKQIEQQFARREEAADQQAAQEQAAANREQIAAGQSRAKAEGDAARIASLAEQAKVDAADLEDPDGR